LTEDCRDMIYADTVDGWKAPGHPLVDRPCAAADFQQRACLGSVEVSNSMLDDPGHRRIIRPLLKCSDDLAHHLVAGGGERHPTVAHDLLVMRQPSSERTNLKNSRVAAEEFTLAQPGEGQVTGDFDILDLDPVIMADGAGFCCGGSPH
jgi:hypothetical protein